MKKESELPPPESLSSNHQLSVTDSDEWYLDFLGGQVGDGWAFQSPF